MTTCEQLRHERELKMERSWGLMGWVVAVVMAALL